MTDQSDTTTESTEAPPSLGTIEYIDPETLELEANVRDVVEELAKDFLDSLREHGVIVPITAVRGQDGRTVVREGQCRTLGARVVGLHQVPVYVLTAAAADTDAATVERIVHQIVANDQRSALTDAQRARAIQTMLDTGLSATKIAKKLSRGRHVIKAAGVAATSTVAMDALEQGQMDFEEAAALVEFQDDENAIRRLIDAAGTHSFTYTITRLRGERETAQRRAAAAVEYIEQGYTVLDGYPGWNDLTCLSMRYLRTADGNAATEADVKEPAHWAAYLDEDYAYFDRETGEPVNPDLVDDDTREDGDLEAEEGLRHYNTVEERPVFLPQWYCLDYTATGLTLAPSMRNQRGDTPTVVDDDPEAQARLQEGDRRERRKVVALNRLGEAAAVVRLQYVTKLLARKTPPKGAATFTAYCFTRDRFIQSQNHGEEITAQMLGVKDFREVRALVSDASTNVDARAQVITLATVLGALEARCVKDAWRSAKSGITGSAMYNAHTLGSDVYLRFLVETGYAPTEVEKVILGETTADEVYDAEVTQSIEL
jgi:ParB family transcriptional regulator, chromosome partitioning protein